MPDYQEYLRRLPAVDKVINAFSHLPDSHRELVVAEVQQIIEGLRRQILAAKTAGDIPGDVSVERVIAEARSRLDQITRPNLTRVINATGTVIHTNLGRAPLSEAAREAVAAAAGYCNLEMEMDSGRRGSRQELAQGLLCRLTGAEAAMVVNNNAAAVMLALTVMASGREVVVSRGQLVEIGGSFRIPEVMKLSGAKLVEVGTTNRTHPRDYEAAINENTALLLRVDPSNYRMHGFTSEVGMAELVEIGRRYQIPVMEDAGSGVLVDPAAFGLPAEPTVAMAITAGADLVTFSGDKLLGGPQAGIIVGRREYIAAMRKHQLARAVRIDKLCLAALEATLRQYLLHQEDQIPAWKLLSLTKEELYPRVKAFQEKLQKVIPAGSASLEIREGESAVGGGAMPDISLPAFLLEIVASMGEEELSRRLRLQDPPVVTRRNRGALVVDLRTVAVDEEGLLLQGLCRAFAGEVE